MNKLKVVKAYGTYFDIGYTLGRHLKDEIKHAVDDPGGSFQLLLQPFYESVDGRVVCEELLASTKNTYPQYVEEIQGLAEGSGTQFIQIFLLNARIEISILSDSRQKGCAEGCTTMLVNNEATAALVHNEDLPPTDGGVWLCAHIFPDPVKKKQEAFFAYCCPGILPGGSSGFNMHGLAMTENFLLPRHVNTKGIPRKVLDRAMISASSIDEAVTLACRPSGFASGGSNSFAQNISGTVMMANVEFFSSKGATCYDRSDVQPNNIEFHFNEYRRARVDYIPDLSSQSRLARIYDIVRERGKPRALQDVLQIMGDSTVPSLPIYRTGTPPDTLETAFTACFNMRDQILDVYTSNPVLSVPDSVPFSLLQTQGRV